MAKTPSYKRGTLTYGTAMVIRDVVLYLMALKNADGSLQGLRKGVQQPIPTIK
ncbi:hypothetical protein MtrunA17_Chr8g0343601 [Medicago truncatula]|uniref:Uncharacterized protein n=1 Tax=Medicago truncatula TaxID=3880 RepID=A0A396GD91_MEDTR|nr:hypothetical protein MtrunA17_Chr8g0343601 [Medicago truncatula]